MNPFSDLFAKTETDNELPPGLLTEVARQESNYNPTEVGPKTKYGTAKGLFQFIDPTAKEFGIVDPFDPVQSTQAAGKYLSQLNKKYKGDWVKTLAAYNWGPGNVDKHGLDNAPPETQKYIYKIAGKLGNALVGTAQADTLHPDAESAIFGAPADTNPSVAPEDESAIFGQPTSSAAAPKWVTDNEKNRAQWQAQVDAYNTPQPSGDTLGRRFALGAAEVPYHGAQYLARGVKALGDATGSPNLTAFGQEKQTALDQATRANEAEQQAIAPEGVDWARGGGEVAATLPFGAGRLVTGAAAKAVPILGAVVNNAFGGALTGAALTNPAEQSVAAGAGVGAVGGAVLGPILGKVGKYIGEKFGLGVSDAKIVSSIDDALMSQGVDPSSISQQIKADIANQVSKALKAGKPLNAEATANAAAGKELGIDLTRGQINRDPMQFSNESNLRQQEGADSLRQQYRGGLQKLVGGLDEVRTGTGGVQASPYEASQGVIDSLAAADDAARSKVSAAYTSARESAGKDLDVPLQNFAQDYAKTLEDFGPERIPSAIRKRIESYGILGGNQAKVFTTADAEQLLQIINKNTDFRDKPSTAALAQLRESVKRALLDADSGGGPFAYARKLAKTRFDVHDAIPALKAVSDGKIEPDDFLNKFVVGAKTQDLAQLKNFLLKTDYQSWNDIRAQSIDKIRSAAVRGEGQDTNFLYDSYRKALASIPKEKLNILFTKDEIGKLRLIERTAKNIQSAPPGSVPNRSGTAAALVNQLNRVLTKIPFASQLVSNEGRRFANSARAGAAVKGASLVEKKAVPTNNFLDIFSRSGGGVLTAPLLTPQNNPLLNYGN